MPSNACFCNISSTGIPRLRRVLRAVAWLYPDIGYCQGTGMVRTCCKIARNVKRSGSGTLWSFTPNSTITRSSTPLCYPSSFEPYLSKSVNGSVWAVVLLKKDKPVQEVACICFRHFSCVVSECCDSCTCYTHVTAFQIVHTCTARYNLGFSFKNLICMFEFDLLLITYRVFQKNLTKFYAR